MSSSDIFGACLLKSYEGRPDAGKRKWKNTHKKWKTNHKKTFAINVHHGNSPESMKRKHTPKQNGFWSSKVCREGAHVHPTLWLSSKTSLLPHSSLRSPDEIWDIISGRNQSESQNYGEFTGCQKVNLWHWSRPEWIFHEYTKVFTFPRVTNRSRAWRAGQSSCLSCRSCRAISSIIPAALMSEMRFKSAN